MMIRRKGGHLNLFLVDFCLENSDDLMKEGSDVCFV